MEEEVTMEQVVAQVVAEVSRTWDRDHGVQEPDWEPLISLFGPCRFGETGRHSPACGFMFMGYEAGPPGSGGIRLYKHGITRRYLRLDARGQAYRFVSPADPRARGGWYEPIPLAEALRHVYEDIERFGATVNTPYDDDYRSRRDAALRAAGYTVISAGPGESKGGECHG